MAARHCGRAPGADDGRVVRPLVSRVATCGWRPSPTRSTGAHDTKPAHWVDANIHAIEVTGGVAALHLIHHLVTGFGTDPTVTEALRTRTFYVVPRVNPDGVEWALADSPAVPAQQRAAVAVGRRARGARPAPARHQRRRRGAQHAHRRPARRLDGLGRRAAADGARACRGRARGRPALPHAATRATSSTTTASPCRCRRRRRALDMNRNFPAGWGTTVHGSGDHPLSEPEIDALVRAIVARPNICGYNAYHTGRWRAAATQQHRGRQRAAAGRRVGVEAARRDAARRSPATRCTRCSRTSRSTRATR